MGSKLLFLLDRPRSLVLIGESRTGKTSWARSLGTHIYWAGLTDAKQFNADADYVIFDDFDWKYMPNKKQWLGCQKEFTISDKYVKKLTVTWGKPCIYLCNLDQDFRMHCTPSENDFYRANCLFVNIGDNKFF